jgi:DNA repair protein RecO (recombination protein O)
MDERTTGLILRTRALTESSLIVEWLTRDFGRLSTVAKGARRPKSPFVGKLDLFYLADVTFNRSLRSELHTLREVRVLEYHQRLRHDLGALRRAAYFTQLVERATEAETPVPTVFELTKHVLSTLVQPHQRAIIVFAFEMKLLVELGLKPELRSTGLTPGVQEILAFFADTGWGSVARVKLSQPQSVEIDRFLSRFIEFQLGHRFKARKEALVDE